MVLGIVDDITGVLRYGRMTDVEAYAGHLQEAEVSAVTVRGERDVVEAGEGGTARHHDTVGGPSSVNVSWYATVVAPEAPWGLKRYHEEVDGYTRYPDAPFDEGWEAYRETEAACRDAVEERRDRWAETLAEDGFDVEVGPVPPVRYDAADGG